MTASPAPPPLTSDAVALREPSQLVCPRAKQQWRLSILLSAIVPAAGTVVARLVPDADGWIALLGLALTLVVLLAAAVAPEVRYRIHRWEVTADAVHTRRGLLRVEDRIAPLSRVQTVDSVQSFTQRLFRVRSLTVTTASAAGPIMIEGLDADLAQRLAAELTAITAREQDDAT